VARDLGIVPDRPPGLSGQQWKTLTMGLSWHRGGRSILVRTWLDRLSTERAAAKQLPRARDIEPAPAPARPLASFKAATAFAVLLITVSVWLSLIRVAPAGKSRDNGGPATLAANARSNFGTDANLLADFGPMQASLGDTGPFDALPELPQAASLADADAAADATRRDAIRPRPATVLDPIVVAARNYRIRSGENFAEIRVHRSSQQRRGDTAFVWWTEAASAKPGVDYVQQGKVTQLIPRGKNSTSFFIKLLPTASRSQDEMFYIAIAEAGSGGASGRVERAAVWLPSTHDHS